MVCKSRALGNNRLGICKDELTRRWDELVGDRSLGYGVDFARIGHFDGQVCEGRSIDRGRLGDWLADNFVCVAVGICLWVHRDWERFFRHDSVGMSVNSGIDPDGENVLVVLCQGTRRDDVAIRARLSRVDVDDRHNPSRSRLNGNTAQTRQLSATHPSKKKHTLLPGRAYKQRHIHSLPK